MTTTSLIRLIASIVLCQMAGVIGAIFTTPAIPTWYAALKKPPFTPPGWIFSPVWITLYLLMGVSAFVVWSKGWGDSRVRIALSLFVVQLVLNALWSLMFFGLRSPSAGFINIVVLWIFILLTMLYFFKVSTTAGALLVPYVLWVSFAAVLNFSIWRLNA